MAAESGVDRVREICLALPESIEKPFGGHTAPTWRVRDKTFAMRGEHEGEKLALWCKAPPGAHDVLVRGDPKRFVVPPYVGHNGWVGIRPDVAPVDRSLVAALVADSYRMTAPRRLVSQLQATGQK